MPANRAEIGMCFDRTFPPPLVTDFARRLDHGGADQLWVIEDCFFTAGVSLAASALAVTERLRVGIGILPAVARNAAVTAMEIATLCGLAPGRAGGVLLAEPASPSYVRWALEQCGNPDGFHVAVFSVLCVDDDRTRAYETMSPWLAALLPDPHVGLRALPFFDDLVTRFGRHGVTGLATMPSDWWKEIGPIGTLDDAVAHMKALEAAGVHSIGMFPAPEVDIATAQLDDVFRLGTR